MAVGLVGGNVRVVSIRWKPYTAREDKIDAQFTLHACNLSGVTRTTGSSVWHIINRRRHW